MKLTSALHSIKSSEASEEYRNPPYSILLLKSTNGTLSMHWKMCIYVTQNYKLHYCGIFIHGTVINNQLSTSWSGFGTH